MSETDIEKVIDDTKATIASLEADTVAAETQVKSLWARYEIWLTAFVALVGGLVIGHLIK